ITVQDPATMVS
nr:immunoglobulin heavy chain junction region [Mus musculus]